MRSRWSHRGVAQGFVLILTIVLAGRFVWHLGATETGAQAVAEHFLESVESITGRTTPPVVYRLPTQQAQFWLQTLTSEDAVALLRHPRMRMAAALLLDQPSPAFRNKRFCFGETMEPVRLLNEDLSWEEADSQREAFQRLCHDRCLSYADDATAGDSGSLAAWQVKALLLIRPDQPSELRVHESVWRPLLSECAENDSDNALYDLVAAQLLWRASSTVVETETEELLTISDSERFEEGVAHLERALKKPSLSVQFDGYTAVEELLNQLNLPFRDLPRRHRHWIVNHLDIHSRLVTIVDYLNKVIHARARGAVISGELDLSFDWYNRSALLMDMASQGRNLQPNVLVMAMATWLSDEAAESSLKPFVDRLDRSVVEQLSNRTSVSRAHWHRLAKASQSIILQKASSARATDGYWEKSALVAASLIPFCIFAAFPIGALSALIFFVSRRGKSGRSRVWGVGPQLLLLCIMLAVSLCMFGFGPAQILSDSQLFWAVTIGLALLVLGTSFCLLSPSGPKAMSLSGLLLMMLVFGLISGVIASAQSSSGAFADSLGLDHSPRDWREFSATDDFSAYQQAVPHWLVGIQWVAHHGPAIALWTWFAVVIVVASIRLRHRPKDDPDNGRRSLHGSTVPALRHASESALIAIAAMILCYLAVAPHAIQAGEQEFQEEIAFSQAPVTFVDDQSRRLNTVYSKLK